jgi:predicted TIM-barrel fold metal-dependent hydrolase
VSATTENPFEGLSLIDADSHYSEPADLWTKRAPASIRDRVPQVKPDQRGVPSWFIDGHYLTPATGSSFVDKRGKKVPYYGGDMAEASVRIVNMETIHEASYDPKARVAILDELGIWAQVVYPNTLGFAAPALVQHLDREFSIEIVKIYNDAIAEWQAEGEGRLYPQAVLPFWDIAASVREAARVKELGLTGVTIAGEPHLGGLPDLGQRDWDPLYEALSDLELPIDIHIGSANVSTAIDEPAWKSLPERARKPVFCVQIEMANSRFVSNMLVSDVMLRWPKLRWVSVESGIGWLPYVFERIDYEYREEFDGVEAPSIPTAREMFQRGIYACFWFEDAGPTRLLDAIGEDHILWETDFPHPTCLYPSPVTRSAEKLGHLPRATLKKIMQDNAAQLYKIPLPQATSGSASGASEA